MGLRTLDFVLLRLTLPTLLFGVSIIRYNGFSFTYLLFLLVCPLLKRSNDVKSIARIKIYLITLATLSGIFTLSHPLLHIVTAVSSTVGDLMQNCLSVSNITMQIGFQSFKGMYFHRILRLMLPDPLMLSLSIACLAYFIKRGTALRRSNQELQLQSIDVENPINNSQPVDDQHAVGSEEPGAAITQPPATTMLAPSARVQLLWRAWAIDSSLVVLTVLLTGAAGVMSPSVPSSVYLIVFLAVCTYWACQNKVDSTRFAYLRIFLLVYSGLHLCLYYLYQLPFFQLIFPNDGFSSRLLGIYYIMQTSCTNPGEIDFYRGRWIDYVAPPTTMMLYYVLAVETRRWLDKVHSRPIVARLMRYNIPGMKRSGASRDPERQYLIGGHGPGVMSGGDHVNYSALVDTASGVDPVQPGSPPISEQRDPSSISSAGSAAVVIVTEEQSPPPPETVTQADEHGAILRSEPPTERPLLLSLLDTAIRNSYVITFIAMMAWSVTYRSWLSFIMLLSAGLLWLMPNSRSACLYVSPLIVGYAITLVLLQFVYGLNLNDVELPSHVTTTGGKLFNLTEIGLQKWPNPTAPLAIQIGFLVVFWLTLRLFMRERCQNRQQQVGGGSGGGLATLAALELSTMHTSQDQQLQQTYDLCHDQDLLHQAILNVPYLYGSATHFGDVDNALYRKFTAFLREICNKYWIVLCCTSMLLVSIQQPVVIFRITYMAMLVYFLLVFQISYSFWRKQMLFFWWVVIVYSMFVLLFIYTFQFKSVPYFWQNQTGLSQEVLQDIGLEMFESAALFQRLLTPVVFLVVIILQVHYFHKPFLRISAMNRFRNEQQQSLNSQSGGPNCTAGDTREECQNREAGRSGQNLETASTASALSAPSVERKPTFTVEEEDFMEDMNSALQILWAKLRALEHSTSVCLWRLVEVHWVKVVAIALVAYTIHEVSAFNFFFLVCLVVCFPFPRLHALFATLTFTWSGLQILLKMIYQLKVIKKDWGTNCTKASNVPPLKIPGNNTDWLGLVEVPNFHNYISPMAILLVVSVAWHAIRYRQRQHYFAPRRERPKEGIIFPEVTVTTMGGEVLNSIKFMFNYSFYKLGLELSFSVSVIAACLRVDAVSVLYLCLLVIILFNKREVCARLWPAYLVVLGVLLPLQYAGCVGLPPGLCYSYPWMITNMSEPLQKWLFLPNYARKPNAQKLMADFFQFMFVALQFRVFKIEGGSEAANYGGGDNKPVLTNDLPRATDKDFVSNKDSYMDYVKHAVFFWSYWVSLAIVFATGIFKITLFCLGYMILSFVYLWMGQNVLLRGRPNLIRSWNVIIAYNFCVILTKSSLQLIGCVYLESVIQRFCLLVQLLGIQCMNPLSGDTIPTSDLSKTPCQTNSSGLELDVVCFVFIILQRKIFMTHNFCHVFVDLIIQSRFASRGAYLINRKLMLAIKQQSTKELHSVEKVRAKLSRIERRQQELGKNIRDLEEHYLVLRSGDYSLFDVGPEDEDEAPDVQDNSTTDEGLPSQDVVGPGGDKTSVPPDSEDGPDPAGVTAEVEVTVEQESSSEEVVVRRRPHLSIPARNEKKEDGSGDGAIAVMRVDSSGSGGSPRPQQLELSGRHTLQVTSPRQSVATVQQHSQAQPAQGRQEDDEDDANPPALTPTARMNPIQILNQAIEYGARSTVRQLRRSVSEKEAAGGQPRRSSLHAPGGVRLLETMSEMDEGQEEAGSASNDLVQGSPSCPAELSLAAIGQTPSERDRLLETSVGPAGDTVDMVGVSTGKVFDDAAGSDRGDGCWSKFKAGILIFYIFLTTSTDSLIRLINVTTREYRRIRRTLDQERRAIKRRIIASVEATATSGQADDPMERLESIVQETLSNPDGGSFVENRTTRSPTIILDAIIVNAADSADVVVEDRDQAQRELEREKEFRQSRSKIFLLLIAVGNLAFVYSELICYFLLILNHLRSGNLLSLFYPLMIFLWAMLSVPRPSKTFWIFLITYTELVIVIKYIFQLNFIELAVHCDAGQPSSNEFCVKRLFGVEKNDHYAVYDLIQLLFIFLHRGYLKNYGIWRDHTESTQDLEVAAAENNNKDSGKQRTQSCEERVPPLTVGTGAHYSYNPVTKMRRFYSKMTDPKFNRKVDVYVFMFLCEFIAFLIIIFGYVSFGPSTGMGDNAIEFIKANRIPVPFITMLIVQFVFIIIDRALFLRKQVLGKFIFQIIHVILIHGWLFFILPYITKNQFTSSPAPQLLYLVKCIYFGLSAYQVRSGYPRRILGNFLTKNYNYYNLILFKGYMIVPFLYELRNVMDWMWTDTSLALYHYMELEDVFAKIFVLKCWRRSELEYPTPRGNRRSTAVKYTVGGLLLLFFFVCFWGPLTLGTVIQTTFGINSPQECNLALSFGGFPPIWSYTSSTGSLNKVNEATRTQLKQCFWDKPAAQGFLQYFDVEDISNVTMDGFSGTTWSITPPSYQLLLDHLEMNETLFLKFHMQCRRSNRDVESAARRVGNIFSRKLEVNEKQLIRAVLRNRNNSSLTPSPSNTVTLHNITHRFVIAKKDLLEIPDALKPFIQLTVNASLLRDPLSNLTWWELQELNTNTNNNSNCKAFTEPIGPRSFYILSFNERVSDNLFGKLFSSYGIIGMYAAYIFVAHRLLRTIYSDISYIIRLEELPHVDRILNLLRDVYLVRENGLLRLEEQLFARIIFLYRSSETMIQWTKHPKWVLDRHTKRPNPSPPAQTTDTESAAR